MVSGDIAATLSVPWFIGVSLSIQVRAILIYIQIMGLSRLIDIDEGGKGSDELP
jgi:hypothetical protein